MAMTPMTKDLIEKTFKRLKPHDGIVKVTIKRGDVYFMVFEGSDENGFHFAKTFTPSLRWTYSSTGFRKGFKGIRETDIISIKHITLEEVVFILNKARRPFENSDFYRFLT